MTLSDLKIDNLITNKHKIDILAFIGNSIANYFQLYFLTISIITLFIISLWNLSVAFALPEINMEWAKSLAIIYPKIGMDGVSLNEQDMINILARITFFVQIVESLIVYLLRRFFHFTFVIDHYKKITALLSFVYMANIFNVFFAIYTSLAYGELQTLLIVTAMSVISLVTFGVYCSIETTRYNMAKRSLLIS